MWKKINFGVYHHVCHAKLHILRSLWPTSYLVAFWAHESKNKPASCDLFTPHHKHKGTLLHLRNLVLHPHTLVLDFCIVLCCFHQNCFYSSCWGNILCKYDSWYDIIYFFCKCIVLTLGVTIQWFTEICVRFVSYLTGPFMIIYWVEFVLRDVFSQSIIKVDSLPIKALLQASCMNCWNWETVTWISLAPFVWINLELQPWLIL